MINRKLLIGVLIILLTIVFIVWFTFYKPIINPSIKTTSATKMTINTDKTEYKKGEIVKIIITNNSKYSIAQQGASLINIKPVKFLGENYGIGFIEKFRQGGWDVVEPVWRCNNSCFTECVTDHFINPGKNKIFKWRQTILNCDKLNHTERVEQAGSGKYRISSAIWDDQKQTNKIIYSNEFIIKD